MKTDCDKLNGRLRDLCRGHDDDGNPVSTPEKRAAWQRYFHGVNGPRFVTGKPIQLTPDEKEARRARIKAASAEERRLIGWLTFFRAPGERGIGDTALRMSQLAWRRSPTIKSLVDGLMKQCACKRLDAVSRLNKEHPYANT